MFGLNLARFDAEWPSKYSISLNCMVIQQFLAVLSLHLSVFVPMGDAASCFGTYSGGRKPSVYKDTGM
jgi:hypothetical protein